MEMRSDFAVFITSHERANNVKTLEVLRQKNYDGDAFIVIDDTDKQKENYIKKYGDKILIFNKKETARTTDAFNNDVNLVSAVYARIFVEKEARKRGLSAFAVCDDDFSNFSNRYVEDEKLKSANIDDMGKVMEYYIELILENGISVVGFGLDGSYIGGAETFLKRNGRRRCFGFFIRNTNVKFDWVSDVNEDYISCILQGKIGKIVLEFADVQAITKNTGKGKENGGLKCMYENTSKYERTFKAVMAYPSAFSIGIRKGEPNIIFEEAKGVPCIISGRWKK